jgi:hypothetical protein
MNNITTDSPIIKIQGILPCRVSEGVPRYNIPSPPKNGGQGVEGRLCKGLSTTFWNTINRALYAIINTEYPFLGTGTIWRKAVDAV